MDLGVHILCDHISKVLARLAHTLPNIKENRFTHVHVHALALYLRASLGMKLLHVDVYVHLYTYVRILDLFLFELSILNNSTSIGR